MDVTPNTRKHEARETERALAAAETIALFLLSDVALDWPRRWEKLFPTDDLDAVLDGYRRPGFKSYWDVTQAFADHSRANRDWWKSLPPEG